MSWWKAYEGLSLTGLLERISSEGWFWAAKRLSGNDTGVTGSHAAGIYLPKWFFKAVFPDACVTNAYNPRSPAVACYFPNEDVRAERVSAIYYNSRFFPERGLLKKYNEFRLTGWGGCAVTPVQDPENTGALAIIAGSRLGSETALLAWVCSTPEQELLLENWLGRELQPGQVAGNGRVDVRAVTESLRALARKHTAEKWLSQFPTGEQIFAEVEKAIPHESWDRGVDALLLKRRALEFAIFEHIEKALVEPAIHKGFRSVDDFLELALSVANRRKARTGRSLELNLGSIFASAGIRFEEQATTENNKIPDFLFPSAVAYHNPAFPRERLHMMGAKTCCKDRWRQIINEADRISPKHLFTLQEGVSSAQLAEMKRSNVVLVAPKPNIRSFPAERRPDIMHLQGFVAFIKRTQVTQIYG
ncbi:MAG: type II restriction endonuclease [Lentisphaerae bacterium]|nr:type II restriction endonuclease [Lentisphaerota bacterium]